MSQEKETKTRTAISELERWLATRIMNRTTSEEAGNSDREYNAYTAGLRSVLNYIREEL